MVGGGISWGVAVPFPFQAQFVFFDGTKATPECFSDVAFSGGARRKFRKGTGGGRPVEARRPHFVQETPTRKECNTGLFDPPRQCARYTNLRLIRHILRLVVGRIQGLDVRQ